MVYLRIGAENYIKMPASSMFVSVLACNLLTANFVDFLQIAASTSALRLSYFLLYVSVVEFREVPEFIACNCAIHDFKTVFAQ